MANRAMLSIDRFAVGDVRCTDIVNEKNEAQRSECEHDSVATPQPHSNFLLHRCLSSVSGLVTAEFGQRTISLTHRGIAAPPSATSRGCAR